MVVPLPIGVLPSMEVLTGVAGADGTCSAVDCKALGPEVKRSATEISWLEKFVVELF